MLDNRPSSENQLVTIWSHLQWPQRVTILAFGFVGLVLIGVLVYFMNRVEYEALYRDLSPEDAQAIAAKLKEQKRDYIVQGTSILVAAPKAEVDKLRLEIAGAGLARSGRVGYEIFDKSQFGMTDFTEQVNLQRALEGELARTISSLSEISESRVHLVLPKDSIFEERKEEAKASVVVRLKRGSELTKLSISGIKGLVAGAVPGLHTYNVSIVDDEGRLLSKSVESAGGAQSEMESGIREQIEKEMAGKVVSILEPLVGKGKVHANASIDLDFNTTEQTEETFDPNPAIIVSQQRTEERTSGSATASGIPGTQSNMTTDSVQETGYSPERLRQSETTNYEINKLVRHTIQPKGTIRRLSVAVVLDHKTTYSKTSDGKLAVTSQERSQKDLDSYRELVLAAVGYDKERGDVVTIENVPFYEETLPEEDQPVLPWNFKWQVYLMPAMKYASFIVLFLLAYLLMFRPLRKRLFQTISVAELNPKQQMGELAPENQTKALSGSTQPEELGPPTDQVSATNRLSGEHPSLEAIDDQIERELMKEAGLVNLGNRKFGALKKKLAEKAKKDPEIVSQLIRSWMQERA